MPDINLNKVSLQEDSIPIHIQLTNSGTGVADAYVFVDFDASSETNSIYISSSSGTGYIGIADYIYLSMNGDYKLKHGRFNNTEINKINNKIVLSTGFVTGNYITPIIDIEDDYFPANVTFLTNTTSGINNLKFYYRASNTKPIALNEVYLSDNSRFEVISGEDVSFNSWGHTAVWIVVSSNHTNGLVCVSTTSNEIITFDRDGNTLFTSNTAAKYEFDKKMVINSEDIIYGYNTSEHVLVQTTPSFSYYNDYDQGTNFLIDFDVDPTESGTVWYLNYYSHGATRLSKEFDVLGTVYFDDPVSICCNNDGGCWVADANNNTVNRVDPDSYEVIKTIVFDEYPKKVYSDLDNGFWFLGNNVLIHINSAGEEVVRGIFVGITDLVITEGNYMILHTKSARKDIMVNKNTLIPVESFIKANDAIPGYMFKEFNNKKTNYSFFPLSYDNVWGDNPKLNWIEINNNTYMPKFRYYQFKIEFETNDTNISPEFSGLYLSKSLRFENIVPSDTIDFYLKFSNYDSIDYGDYLFRIKYIWSENG